MTIDTDVEVIVISKEELQLGIQRSQQQRQAFFEFWKKGVKLSGIEFFGDGSQVGYEKALAINDLQPIPNINKKVLNKMSHGEAAFFASMISFYNSAKADELSEIANIKSIGDLKILDRERRNVIANLLINYKGW